MYYIVISFLVAFLSQEVLSDQNVTAPPTACEPWPKSLKPLNACCIVPYHADLRIERSCNSWACWKMNGTANITALELSFDCYVNKTQLLVKGQFSKAMAKAIYKNYTKSYIKMLGDDPWAAVIDDAVDKCEFVAAKNFSEHLEKFYKCVDALVLRNCPVSAIDSSDECDPVEVYYEKCKNFKHDCKAYPMRLMMPEFCCDYPEMISPKVQQTCKAQCNAKELIVDRVKCNQACVEKSLNIKNGGNFDYEALKKLLMANANTSAIWEKSIDKSVDICKKQLAGSESSDHFDMSLTNCLREVLSDHCMSFKGDVSCNKIKRYWAVCPNSKPNRPKPAVVIATTEEPSTEIPVTHGEPAETTEFQPDATQPEKIPDEPVAKNEER